MPCSGNPDNCAGQPEGWCNDCGCDWDWEFGFCYGRAASCNTHTEPYPCQDCGCGWTDPYGMQINIGDAWKDVIDVVIRLEYPVGAVWKGATEIYVNVGDVWKRVF